MNEMFGAVRLRRDNATSRGIVLNRWGHAYFAPPVGWFLVRADSRRLAR